MLKDGHCGNIVANIGKCPNGQEYRLVKYIKIYICGEREREMLECFGKLTNDMGKMLVMSRYLRFVLKII